MNRKDLLLDLYKRLHHHFGPLNWWPGDSPFEIAVGAILTQNTAWRNVEKAIDNLKAHNLLSPEALNRMALKDLAEIIKPAGYYNIKAHRLKRFLDFLFRLGGDGLDALSTGDLETWRDLLLQVHGIGPETADSILLYAADRPTFVVDAYTKRVLARHQLLPEEVSYDEVRSFFMDVLDPEASFYNEFHALLVNLGKTFCKKRNPTCAGCPAAKWNPV